MPKDQIDMTYSRRKKTMTSSKTTQGENSAPEQEEKISIDIPEDLVVKSEVEEPEVQTQPTPTGKIFLGEEDKRLLKKFNNHLVKKLGVGGNRSFKL
jgi:hypothetical protein